MKEIYILLRESNNLSTPSSFLFSPLEDVTTGMLPLPPHKSLIEKAYRQMPPWGLITRYPPSLHDSS